MRASVARRDYPRIIIVGGVTVLFFSLVDVTVAALADLHVSWTRIGIQVCMGIIMLTAGWAIARSVISDAVMPWVFSALGILMAVGLCATILSDPAALNIGALLLLIMVLGASTLYWIPYLVQSAAILVMGSATVLATDNTADAPSLILLCAALLVGAGILWIRSGSIDETADASAQAAFLATHDQLTGNLNRHGVFAKVPALWADAQERGTDLFVVFLDIRRLKQANDRYGHEFGDQVIAAAAWAVSAVAAPGQVVGRWGGDEIIVVSAGSEGDAQALMGRISGRPVWPPEITARWDGELSVGHAVGDPAAQDIDDLIRVADERMYEQRRGAPD